MNFSKIIWIFLRLYEFFSFSIFQLSSLKEAGDVDHVFQILSVTEAKMQDRFHLSIHLSSLELNCGDWDWKVRAHYITKVLLSHVSGLKVLKYFQIFVSRLEQKSAKCRSGRRIISSSRRCTTWGTWRWPSGWRTWRSPSLASRLTKSTPPPSLKEKETLSM